MSPFTKHYVDNEVLMLCRPPFTKHKVEIKCLCYGENSPTLSKNNQVECSAPFTKHNVDNEVLMLWGK